MSPSVFTMREKWNNHILYNRNRKFIAKEETGMQVENMTLQEFCDRFQKGEFGVNMDRGVKIIPFQKGGRRRYGNIYKKNVRKK